MNQKYSFFSILLIISLLLHGSCSFKSAQSKGEVTPEEFSERLEFTTGKSLIQLPVLMDGESKVFLFDTGADVTLVQRDSTFGNTVKVGGASDRNVKMGSEYISSFKIGETDFQNTYAINGDLEGLKEQIDNFGGIIGQPIISKANWLINYPDRIIEFSNKDLSDDTFQNIPLKRIDGAPYTFIEIDGKKYKAVIDLGSSSALSIPKGSKLAKRLEDKINWTEFERDVYTIGGIQSITEKRGTLPTLKIGEMTFNSVDTNIRKTSQLRLGMRFFVNCSIYIDNISNGYQIRIDE